MTSRRQSRQVRLTVVTLDGLHTPSRQIPIGLKANGRRGTSRDSAGFLQALHQQVTLRMVLRKLPLPVFMSRLCATHGVEAESNIAEIGKVYAPSGLMIATLNHSPLNCRKLPLSSSTKGDTWPSCWRMLLNGTHVGNGVIIPDHTRGAYPDSQARGCFKPCS